MSVRILMFSLYFPPQYSGAAKQAIALARHLRLRGHHIEFITVRWPGLDAREDFDGFTVHRIEMGRGSRHKELRLWWNLARFVLMRRHDFDIIHSHGAYFTNSIIGPLGRLFGWRSLVKASLADNDLHGLNVTLSGRLHHRFLAQVNAYVAISRDLEAEFLASGLPSGKTHYLPNGVDTTRFCPAGAEERKALRRALGIPEGRSVALTVGVFDRRKNIGWLMEEWVKNKAFGTETMLLAIGPRSREDEDGTFMADLKRLAAENPDFLGMQEHVDDIERYYQASDLFVLPSHSEGMPNVVLEAMASGLPCVATRVSGVTDLVEEGKTGYTYVPNDACALGEAMGAVLAESAGAMGRRARCVAEEQFALSTLAGRYEVLYLELMKS